MVDTKVTYLGVQITHGSRRLSSDRVQGILQLPSPMTWKQLRAFLGLTGYCRIQIPSYGLIAQPLYESLKGWDDSIPLMWGTPQKKAEATLKQALTRAPALRLPDPEKSIPTLCPWKRGNSFGSVNSKVGIWAPACSLLIQKAQSNYPRLASLPSKSKSYCNHDRRCFKTLLWRQTNYFYQPPSKATLKWEKPFMDVWSKNPQISSSADEKSRLTISPCEVLNSATLLPTPWGLSPLSLLSRNLGPLDKTMRGIVRRFSNQSWGNLVHWWKQLCLGWKKKSQIGSSLQFWDHRG